MKTIALTAIILAAGCTAPGSGQVADPLVCEKLDGPETIECIETFDMESLTLSYMGPQPKQCRCTTQACLDRWFQKTWCKDRPTGWSGCVDWVCPDGLRNGYCGTCE